MPEREYVVVAASKPKDPLIRSFLTDDYRVSRTWPTWGERIILWPKVDSIDDIPEQADLFQRLLYDAYKAGGWTLYLDEARYLSEYLGLSRQLELLWIQGRSLKVTVVASAQRPRHLPLAAYSQATHLFIWRNRDRADLRRLSEISGEADLPTIVEAVQTLQRHEVLYVDAQRGMLHKTLVG